MLRRATYGGLQVSLDTELAELPPSDDVDPACLTVSSDRRRPSCRERLSQPATADSVAMRLSRIGGKDVFTFNSDSVFEFDRASRTVTYRSPLDAPTRHHLLDHVLPRVLGDLGHLMIHGSAIQTPNGAVIFIGDTGLGKSTLAASFQRACSGVELLSDDCVRLTSDPDGRVSCVPTYRCLRLWPDSADALMPSVAFRPVAPDSDKRRLDLVDTAAADPTTVSAICVLSDPDEGPASVLPLAPAQAVVLLVAQCFRLDPSDSSATRQTFERCAEVVERVPVVELRYPREYDRLPEAHEAVLRRARNGDWTTFTPT